MRFSIIIPTFNRPGPLARCLTALQALDFPRDAFEVLVVDDGTLAFLAEIIAQYAANLPVKYLRNPGRGPSQARNFGLRNSRGDYVVFTDDDCLPHPQWLRAFDRAFAQYPAAGLGGSIVSTPDSGIFGETSQLLVTFLYGYTASSRGNLMFFCSNNLAFPRRALLDGGGFDESFPLAAAEDRELCARWRDKAELEFVPDASVQHRQELKLKSFFAQHYRYGKGAFHFWARRRGGHGGPRVESWRFYFRMLLFPFGKSPLPRAVIQSALLMFSQAACAFGYFDERWSSGRTAASSVNRTASGIARTSE